MKRSRSKVNKSEETEVSTEASTISNSKRKRNSCRANSVKQLNGQSSGSPVKRRKKDNEMQTATVSKTSVDTKPSCSKEQCPKAKKKNTEDFIRSFQEDLTCNICSELFLNSVTLECSHSYCNFCIKKWLKNHVTCPTCRRIVVSRNPSLILDRFVEKVLVLLPEEARNHRRSLIDSRKNQEGIEDSTDEESTDEELSLIPPSSELIGNIANWFGNNGFREIIDLGGTDDDSSTTNYNYNDACAIN